MTAQASKIYSVALVAILAAVVVLFPIIPSYSFVNPELWRQLILIGLAVFLLFFLFVLVIFNHEFKIKTSLVTAGLLVWSLATIAAAAGSLTSLKSLTTPTTYLPLATLILYTLLHSFLVDKANVAKWLVMLSGVVLSIVSLVIMFTPGGLAVSAGVGSFLFLGATLAVAIAEIIESLPGTSKTSQTIQTIQTSRKLQIPLRLVTAVLAALIITAAISASVAGLAGVPLLKTKVTAGQSLSLNSSWIVAADSIKYRPLLGAGIGNFMSVYTHSRTELNLFGASGNQVFESLTTAGLLGLASLVILLLTLLWEGLKAKPLFVKLLTLAIVVWSLAAPFNTTTLLLILPLALVLGGEKGFSHNLSAGSPVGRAILGVLAVLCLVVVYLTGRVAAADIYFMQSVSGGSVQAVYDNAQKSVELNPYNDTYHRAFAANSIAIARSLAQNKDLSDQDKQNITTLIRVAVSEANNAAGTLDPYNFMNWQGRAAVYEALVGLDKDATASALASYNQALALDPQNPGLLLTAGNFLMGQKSYQNAAQLYASAINLKGDYAEAHLNLAAALQALGAPADAAKELTVVRNLIPDKSSADYQNITKLIDELNKQATAPASKSGTQPKTTTPVTTKK